MKNARAWASAAAGEDLAGQIDPEFALGPHAPPWQGRDHHSHRDLPDPAQHLQEPRPELSNVFALKRHGPRNSRM